MSRRWFRLGLALALAIAAVAQADEATKGGDVAEELPTGEELVRRVNARDDGEFQTQTLVMRLVDARGHERERRTRTLRRDTDGERRILIYFESPKNVKGTAFLAYDYADPGRDDDQWLYLPALRRSRRIAAADRGSSFVGTDFSYEEVEKGGKLDAADYRFRTLGREKLALEGEEQPACDCYRVEGIPVSDDVARELGYGRIQLWIDPESWMVRQVETWDRAGRPKKRIEMRDVRRVQGVWTAHEAVARDHQSGHTTTFRFEDVDYETEIDPDVFTERTLRRGL